MTYPADEITLTGLRAHGFHGVYPEERRVGQEFVVDVTMTVDTRRAAASDDVTDTVHYGDVAEAVVRDKFFERLGKALDGAGGVAVGASLEGVLPLELEQHADVVQDGSDLFFIHARRVRREM